MSSIALVLVHPATGIGCVDEDPRANEAVASHAVDEQAPFDWRVYRYRGKALLVGAQTSRVRSSFDRAYFRIAGHLHAYQPTNWRYLALAARWKTGITPAFAPFGG